MKPFVWLMSSSFHNKIVSHLLYWILSGPKHSAPPFSEWSQSRTGPTPTQQSTIHSPAQELDRCFRWLLQGCKSTGVPCACGRHTQTHTCRRRSWTQVENQPKTEKRKELHSLHIPIALSDRVLIHFSFKKLKLKWNVIFAVESVHHLMLFGSSSLVRKMLRCPMINVSPQAVFDCKTVMLVLVTFNLRRSKLLQCGIVRWDER